MGERTGIGWTSATWNPVTGCSRVSLGCEHCYAEALSLRMGWSKKPWTKQNAAENVQTHPVRLQQPIRWRLPRRVFVNSMSDLFHPLVPDDFVDDVFAVMSRARQHEFQVLTKRADRMLAYMTSTSNGARRQMHVQASLDRMARGEYVRGWPLPNVWLGVSVEDQRRADERIPPLLETPAAVRFISAEPLLGPINLHAVGCGPWWNALTGCGDRAGSQGLEHMAQVKPLDWLIIGGESGPHHRPMSPRWAEAIAAQGAAAGCAVFVKQDSGPRPGKQGRLSDALWALKQYPMQASGLAERSGEQKGTR